MAPPLTQLVIDGHLHLYPRYDVARAINSLLDNLGKFTSPSGGASTVFIGLLAESQSCRFYQEILKHGEACHYDPFTLVAGPDAGAITLLKHDQIMGYLIAGRQIVTSEKLEILALGMDISVKNGLSAEDTLQAIRAQHAVPVLSWSPGKWFFSRGKRIQTLIETQPGGSFLIGDTGLRPTFWPVPRLMKMASRRGYRIIGGSDPLPIPGEECWIGTYGMTVTAEFDREKPAESLRRLLANPTTPFTPIGHRSPPFAFFSRWIRNQSGLTN
jgi:hypothetical protein